MGSSSHHRGSSYGRGAEQGVGVGGRGRTVLQACRRQDVTDPPPGQSLYRIYIPSPACPDIDC